MAHRSGRPLHVIDGLLLAAAEVHALTLVTRNAGDFEGRGVSVENPYFRALNAQEPCLGNQGFPDGVI